MSLSLTIITYLDITQTERDILDAKTVNVISPHREEHNNYIQDQKFNSVHCSQLLWNTNVYGSSYQFPNVTQCTL